MTITEIRAMKTDELQGELDRLRRHLFDLRTQAVTEKLGDPTQLGKTKKDIARVLTMLTERGVENVEQAQVHLEAAKIKAKAKGAAARK